MKQILPVLFLLIFFFLRLQAASAFQIVINEVSPASDPEWIELYNNSDETVDISGWKFVDAANHSKTITSSSLSAHGYFVFENPSGWLNNSGQESLFLKNISDELIDSVIYGTGGIVGIPIENKSMGRSPDGSSNWLNNLEWSRGSPNIVATITVSPNPTQAPSSTPTPSPTPAKSIYKINNVKDSDGLTISNSKIYVDGSYIHHYAPESITFCLDCFCDDSKEISCGFGTHTISLVRENYEDWKEQKTFNPGEIFDANPVLTKIAEVTPVSSPTNSPTKSRTPTPTISSSLSVTPVTSGIHKISTPSSSLSVIPGYDPESIQNSTDSSRKSNLILGQSTSSSAINGEPDTPRKISFGNPLTLKYTFLFGLVVISLSGGLLYFRHRRD